MRMLTLSDQFAIHTALEFLSLEYEKVKVPGKYKSILGGKTLYIIPKYLNIVTEAAFYAKFCFEENTTENNYTIKTLS